MRNLLIIISMFFVNITLAQNDSIKKILQKHFKQISEIECLYKQEKHLSMINKPLISTGIFRYDKKGDMIWEQENPFEQIYSINKKSNNTSERYINQFIISILNGEILENKKVQVSYLDNNDQYIAIITPNKNFMQNKINEIKLNFNKQSLALNSLKIIFSNNDITNINFYDLPIVD